ncbi:MAG TPA: hypothetical protein VMY05_10160 [Acidobacteriota bacterium]|nr:hypothetical protein [Acidobacteriota bacterium]
MHGDREWIQVITGCALLGLVCLFPCGTATAARVQLPAGTEVKVKFDPLVTINSGRSVAGVPLQVHLAEAITVSGRVVVEEGAVGTATIMEVVQAGRGGKPGKISVSFVELQTKGLFKAPDDALIKLAGSETRAGKGKKLLSYLFIAGLFIKGGQAEIPTDQVYMATIAETIILESE